MIYASSLLGNLPGLPPATVITDGFDPLRDEGAGYADNLRQAGVSVTYRNLESATHEFSAWVRLSMYPIRPSSLSRKA